jgi:hypothetical protein
MDQITYSTSVTMEDMERQFTAVIEKKGRWYVAFVEEIPGVNTQGRTLADARREPITLTM